jgi:hypothetical protein
MKVLYVGSGKSALEASNSNFDDHFIVCVNNAWKIFQGKRKIDVWLHTGDFPRENYASPNEFNLEISYKDYQKTSKEAADILQWKTKSPERYAGYTAFFQGLYWIFFALKPEKIGLLGFDHDYNPAKSEKWILSGKPNIQNQFNNKSEKTIAEWSANFFKDYEPDFFYGHGTPDPLRLGDDHLLEKMNLAIISAKKLQISLVNYSNIYSTLNPIQKDSLIWS